MVFANESYDGMYDPHKYLGDGSQIKHVVVIRLTNLTQPTESCHASALCKDLPGYQSYRLEGPCSEISTRVPFYVIIDLSLIIWSSYLVNCVVYKSKT